MDAQKTIEFLLETQARHDAQIGDIRELLKEGQLNQRKHDAEIGEILEVLRGSQLIQKENDRLLSQTIKLVSGMAELMGQHNHRIQDLEGGRN
jgi:hypothetical protein